MNVGIRDSLLELLRSYSLRDIAEVLGDEKGVANKGVDRAEHHVGCLFSGVGSIPIASLGKCNTSKMPDLSYGRSVFSLLHSFKASVLRYILYSGVVVPPPL